jgi:hypothetical protein
MALLNGSRCRWRWRPLNKISPVWLLLSALLLSSTPGRTAEPGNYKEYQIKAAFLYNFTQFIEWPTNAFPEAGAPLKIGILGNDPFGKTLDDLVRDEKVNGHPLVVSRHRRLEEFKDCHILFVSQSEMSRVDDILHALKGRPILTVGESENFARNGGIIRFITEKNKTRLRINANAAKDANLTISAKLLRLAEIVTSTQE